MYAAVSWKIGTSPAAPTAVEAAAINALAGRNVCRLFDGVRVASVRSGPDFVGLNKELRQVSTAFPGQFRYAIFLLRRGGPLRSNAAFNRPCVRAVQAG